MAKAEYILQGEIDMATPRSGFEQTLQGLTIQKDTEAVLTYSFDWSEWLPTGDTIASVVYNVQARANDPDPLVSVNTGVEGGNKTFIKLRDGQEGKIYTVSAKVTTTDGLIDRRNFRVKVLARSA
jgi:hypothetical protein